MKKFIPAILLSALGAFLAASPSHAVTLIESGDAGETLNTAQVIPSGSALLEFLGGALGDNDADLFQIFLTGGQTFSATTISLETLVDLPVNQLLGAPTALLEDPQLFLFDAEGQGIYGNDDSFGSLQPTLLSGEFSPSQAGFYYLAIASAGYNPVSTNGNIFATGTNDVLEPTGPGGELPLSGFAGTSATHGTYAIALTGVSAAARPDSPTSVPEPTAALGLMALGAGATWRQLKAKKQQRSSAPLT
ncbi:MAG: DVUA0089 family protein [Trichocoleus desertorum ATA4-8-CV12]|jgi:hypothetical protein|nr:DVUA0089 family protein [Trichocoleus desertorum ATA4-8-CV12]